MITKKIQLTFLAILCYSFTMACSIPQDSFCSNYVTNSDNTTIYGKIIAIEDFGIDLEVIEILRGEETNSIIRIWSGTDFDCNGPHSLAASDIGWVNDTVIIILDKITEPENFWDVIGDYRRRDPFSNVNELRVGNGIVQGFIAGVQFAPIEDQLWELGFLDFKQRIIEENDCAITVNTKELADQPIITLNNPFNSELHIRIDQTIQNGSLKLYATSGQVVSAQNINTQNEIELNTANLQTGIYFLEIWANEKRLDLIKVVKM